MTDQPIPSDQPSDVPPESINEFREVLLHSHDMDWVEKSLEGLSQKRLWDDPDTGASIVLIKFEKGSGIPAPHIHSSNQFMFCLSGVYRYVPTGTTLHPGDFYWNPKGSTHGPTIADETSVLLEIYDGPHYPGTPSWYSDDADAR